MRSMQIFWVVRVEKGWIFFLVIMRLLRECGFHISWREQQQPVEIY